MKTQDTSPRLLGKARLIVKDKDGNIKADTGFQENTMTNAGKGITPGLIFNVGGYTAFTRLAVGTDATAAAAGQTALGAEIVDSGLIRSVADTIVQSTTTVTNDTVTLTKEWTASGAKTVTEIGVFNAAAGPTMLARKVPTLSVSVSSGETLTGIYVIQQL